MGRAVGAKVRRKDGDAKVTGAAKYIDDLTFPGMLFGATIRSTIPRGEIVNTHLDLAPDFIVADYRDIPGQNYIALIDPDQPCLSEGEIRHVAEPVLLVAHADRRALFGVEHRVRFDYTTLPPTYDPEASDTCFKTAVAVHIPDTDAVPDSGPTVASRTCMIVGKLLERCARDMRRKLGKLTPAQYLKKHGPLTVTMQYEPPAGQVWDDERYAGDAYGSYAWGCNVVEIEVDPVTFEVTPTHVTAVAEIGKAIHPVMAEGQIQGGTAQGLGWALLEEVVNGPAAGGRRRVRMAFGSVAPTVVLATGAAAVLARGGSVAEAQAALARELTPIDDVRSTGAYRQQVAANLLTEFWESTNG